MSQREGRRADDSITFGMVSTCFSGDHLVRDRWELAAH